MKKLILLIVLLTCLTLTVFSAEDILEKGSNGKWFYWTEMNPMYDTVDYRFALYCEVPSYSSPPHPTLIVKWTNGKTQLTIRWRRYLGNNTDVTYRFDAEGATKETWNGSTNSTQVFYPGSSKTVIEFIQRLMKADKLALQITPYSEGQVVEVFDIRGLKNIVEEFNDTLNWIKE